MEKRGAGRAVVNGIDPKEILRERKLLIADADPIHRAFLLKVMVEAGLESQKIFLAKDASEAISLMKSEGIATVLFDDSLGARALETVQGALEGVPTESVFLFLLSADSSQAGVGRAVESDVDGFALKPFSTEEFRRDFLQAFSVKVCPDEFRRVINLGKSRLFEGDLDQAEKLFQKAIDLGPTPSSAHFYAGQVKLMRQLVKESREEFTQGILLNQIHYKCLKALFELLYGQRKIEESYEVLRRLVGVFPESVERLELVIRLAVETGNFLDLGTWYQVYEGQTEKPEALQHHVAAALSVLGRFYLAMNKPDEAMVAFDQALRLGVRKDVYLTYAVEALQKHGLAAEASQLFAAHASELAAA